MRAELSGDGVEVLVVSPGYVSTDLSRNALTASGSGYGQLDKTTEKLYSVQYVAQQIFEGIQKGKKELILAPLHVRLAIIMKRRALIEMKTQ
jgi:short-subunit dehydrogenase